MQGDNGEVVQWCCLRMLQYKWFSVDNFSQLVSVLGVEGRVLDTSGGAHPPGREDMSQGGADHPGHQGPATLQLPIHTFGQLLSLLRDGSLWGEIREVGVDTLCRSCEELASRGLVELAQQTWGEAIDIVHLQYRYTKLSQIALQHLPFV